MTGFERSTQTMSRDTSGCFEPRRSLRSLRQLSPVASQSRSARSAIWFRISACLILYASPTSRVISLIAVSFVTKSHVRQRALPRRFGFAVAENVRYWHDLRRHRRALAQRAPVGRLVDLRHRTLSLQASLEPTHP